ncbi:MAG TPA: hypothetical protein VH234_00260 [Candidatus Saccharimonadales bacterium]|jgi:hypothetical protein|nr:hypothetical protein [Candidatus Saccharimonadales bacterium]
MPTPKKYFHDHLVLLLLSINAFLAAAGSIFILLRLSTSHGTGYIVQYRSSLGISAFKPGSVVDILGLVVFALLVLAIHVMLSLRTYKVHRQLAIAILGLGILLLTLTVIVSNALLALR